MGILDNAGGSGDILIRPQAQMGAQYFLFGNAIGAIGDWPEPENPHAVGFDHGGIDPVKRCARHGAKRGDGNPLQHLLSLITCADYRVLVRD